MIPERTFGISLFDSEKDNQPGTESGTWPELCEELSKHEERPDKSGPAWSPAVFRGNERSNDNVESISVAPFDVDHIGLAELDRLLARLDQSGTRYLVHSTHSHTPDAPRVRVVLDLSRSVLPTEWPRLWAASTAQFAIPADDNARDAARLMFLPSHPPGATPLVRTGGTQALDVDEVVTRFAEEPATTRAKVVGPTHQLPGASPELLEGLRAELRALGQAVEGQGGDALTYRAGALAHDFGTTWDEARSVLLEWDERNSPPWGEAGLREKFENAQRYARGEFGSRRREFEGSPFEREVARALRELKERREKPVEALAPAFTPFGEVRATVASEVKWLVKSLLTEAGVFVVGAEPKSTKTWAALETARAVASGTRAFGEFAATDPRHVALFLLEDDVRSVRSRLQALAQGASTPLEALDHRVHLKCRGALDLGSASDVAWIVASLRQIPEPPALVVIDPFRDAHRADENDSSAMSEIGAQLRAIRDLVGCAVMFIHHTAKAGLDTNARRSGQRLRGSGAVHGLVDGGIYLGSLSGDGGTEWTTKVEVETKAARSAGEFWLTLHVEDDLTGSAKCATWAFSREKPQRTQADLKRTQERAEKLLRVLRDEGPLSLTALSKRAGIRKDDVSDLLDELLAKGLARNPKKGRWEAAEPGSVPAVPDSSGNQPNPTVPVPTPYTGGTEWEPKEGNPAGPPRGYRRLLGGLGNSARENSAGEVLP